MTPGDFTVHSIARECEDFGRGNGCELDGDGMGITCYTTCNYDYCNEVTNRPKWDMFRSWQTTPTSISKTTTKPTDSYNTRVTKPKNVPSRDNDVSSGSHDDAKSTKRKPIKPGKNSKRNGQIDSKQPGDSKNKVSSSNDGKTKQKNSYGGSNKVARPGRRGSKSQEQNDAMSANRAPIGVIACAVISVFGSIFHTYF